MTSEDRARRVAEIRQEWIEIRARAEEYLRAGWDYKDVAAKLGVARGTIYCWKSRMHES